MSFRLFNAPISFEDYIKKILAEKLNVFVIVYLNDILIYIEDECYGNVKTMQWVLDFLQKNRLFANLKKCQFHQNKVRFLEYVVLAQRV